MIDFLSLIENFDNNCPEEIRSLARRFVSGDAPRYLLGRNHEAAVIDDLFNVDGFVDDFCATGSSWLGKQVLPGNQLPHDSIVVNCVSNSRPRTAHNRLAANGVTAIISYSDFCRAYPEKIPRLSFVEQTRADLRKNLAHWRDLYASLCDRTSRLIFDDVLSYRVTGDYRILNNYEYRPWDQYFEDFLGGSIDVFVDAGGYDGDTAQQFSSRYPQYRRIYLFEPDHENLSKARQRLASTRDVEYISLGVSNCSGILHFSVNNGSATSVTDEGGVAIPVTTIDEHIREPVSMIKMDLEGWELNALKGARRHIVEDQPILAISAYHRPADFWRIWEYVHSVGVHYDFYARHYSESWTETVLYFVPKNKF